MPLRPSAVGLRRRPCLLRCLSLRSVARKHRRLQLNAAANGIENCTFVCGKAEEMIDNVIIAYASRLRVACNGCAR